MEDLNLTETELRYFGDLFLCCDEDNSGKVALLKATELFRSSKLPNEVIKQILSITYPSQGAYLNRKQFYSSLKLIAANQANIALRPELVTSQVDLPLPRFTWSMNGSPDLVQLGEQRVSRSLERRNSQQSYRSLRGADEGIVRDVLDMRDEKGETSTDSEVEPNDRTDGAVNLSPGVWSTASDSPTPTNSVAERAWGAPGHTHWCEEQRQLLGTEEESSDRHSSDEQDGEAVEGDAVWSITAEQQDYYTAQFRSLQPDPEGLLAGHIARMFFEKSRLPVQELRQIWQLSDVTRDGALSLSEFNTAMHLVVLRRNHIPLPVTLPASLIPNTEGCSTQVTPETPNIPTKLQNDYHELKSDSNVNDFISYKSNKTNNSYNNKSNVEQVNSQTDYANYKAGDYNVKSHSPVASPGDISSPLKKDSGNKEWTKFIDSPTSSVSSPGPKPVNFDFHKSAVETDPKILHPVPLRVTPESGTTSVEDDICKSPRIKSDIVPAPYDIEMTGTSPKKPQSASASSSVSSFSSNSRDVNDSIIGNDIRPIQRPQPKKHSLKSIGAIPPPPGHTGTGTTSAQTRELTNASSLDEGPISLPNFGGVIKKEKPPPPPPRQYRTHARSSSLDLNKLKHSPVSLLPPHVPPRVSPAFANMNHYKPSASHNNRDIGHIEDENVFFAQNKDNPSFADFAQFPDGSEQADSVVLLQLDATGNVRKHGAFEVYRKPTPRNSQSPENLERDVFLPMSRDLNIGFEDNTSEKEKLDVFKKLQSQNMLLLRLCQDLSVELSVLHAEKAELRAKFDTTNL